MKPKPPHLPVTTSSYRIKRDFPAYSKVSRSPWMESVLAQTMVRGVTAIWYVCSSRWEMKERNITDEMFFYILQGKGRMKVRGRTQPLGPGDCAHFQRGVPHAVSNDPKNPFHVISIHYQAMAWGTLPLPELLGFPVSFRIEKGSLLDLQFRQACREYTLQPMGCQKKLESMVMGILLDLIQNQSRHFHSHWEEKRVINLRRLLPVMEWMKNSAGLTPSLKECAKRVGLSEVQFRRVFRKTIRLAPVQYLQRLRMEKACQLLRETDQTVESVASEVGYAETSFFAHTFKKTTGWWPGQYRNAREI